MTNDPPLTLAYLIGGGPWLGSIAGTREAISRFPDERCPQLAAAIGYRADSIPESLWGWDDGKLPAISVPSITNIHWVGVENDPTTATATREAAIGDGEIILLGGNWRDGAHGWQLTFSNSEVWSVTGRSVGTVWVLLD